MLVLLVRYRCKQGCSDHFARLGELKADYVENTEIMKFSAEQV